MPPKSKSDLRRGANITIGVQSAFRGALNSGEVGSTKLQSLYEHLQYWGYCSKVPSTYLLRIECRLLLSSVIEVFVTIPVKCQIHYVEVWTFGWSFVRAMKSRLLTLSHATVHMVV